MSLKLLIYLCLVGSCALNCASESVRRQKLNFSPELIENFDKLQDWLLYQINLRRAMKKCLPLHGLSEERGLQVIKLEVSNPNSNEKCFLNCLLESLGFSENGNINRQNITNALQEIVGEQRLEDILKSCADVKGDNACETAYKFHVCSAPEFKKFEDYIFNKLNKKWESSEDKKK